MANAQVDEFGVFVTPGQGAIRRKPFTGERAISPKRQAAESRLTVCSAFY